MPGIELISSDGVSEGASTELAGSGLICSETTSSRFLDVPIGTHVISVIIGLSVSYINELTSFGPTTLVSVTRYVYLFDW